MTFCCSKQLYRTFLLSSLTQPSGQFSEHVYCGDDDCYSMEIIVDMFVLHCVSVGYNTCASAVSICPQGCLLAWRVNTPRS